MNSRFVMAYTMGMSTMAACLIPRKSGARSRAMKASTRSATLVAFGGLKPRSGRATAGADDRDHAQGWSAQTPSARQHQRSRRADGCKGRLGIRAARITRFGLFQCALHGAASRIRRLAMRTSTATARTTLPATSHEVTPRERSTMFGMADRTRHSPTRYGSRCAQRCILSPDDVRELRAPSRGRGITVASPSGEGLRRRSLDDLQGGQRQELARIGLTRRTAAASIPGIRRSQ
jgi:hypothetical protein